MLANQGSEEIQLVQALVKGEKWIRRTFRKKKEILKIAAKHGARNIRIFGSVARRETRSDSDVDFLVDMEPGRTLFDMGGLLMDLRDLLGLQVDVVTEQGLKPRIRDRVLREAEL
jgi:predicted nucleotidyltransferase